MGKRRTQSSNETLAFSGTSRLRERHLAVMRRVTRWAAWGVIVVAFVGASLAVIGGARYLLFMRNPHFTLRRVEVVVFGQLPKGRVLGQLRDFGVRVGESNLFRLDLADLRRQLVAGDVMVSQVGMGRILPGTLVVEVYERNPVAQLVSQQGKLLDEGGLILPERNDPRTWRLPVVTGIRGSGDLPVGTRMDDGLVDAALLLLRLVATEPYGRNLDISLIQLDYGKEMLKVYLGARGPFREGACVTVPAREKELREALRRVEVIVRERERGQQTISYIDASYKINVPVRP